MNVTLVSSYESVLGSSAHRGFYTRRFSPGADHNSAVTRSALRDPLGDRRDSRAIKRDPRSVLSEVILSTVDSRKNERSWIVPDLIIRFAGPRAV